MASLPCSPDCPARCSPVGITGPARAAEDCPVTAEQGRWGWPCGRTMADVIAAEAGENGNNVATSGTP